MRRCSVLFLMCLFLIFGGAGFAQVCNLKVVTDANPDYHDMQSMIHSITSKWPSMKEKCWAVWYWNKIARRQTSPMVQHGMPVTDPIRQFNDYGYMMCSTIAGTNCAIWHHMGLKVKFWDISAHTVPECYYDGRWHMYDSSLSAIYTLCDGVTIAGVEDIGKKGACAVSGGTEEPGHIAKYHCLTATSPNGFLTGADWARTLDSEYRCFNPNALKFRYYYNHWNWGHRYILNLRDDEAYTRYYSRQDKDSPGAVVQDPKRKWYRADLAYYVPNHGKDPEHVNPRYTIRGNGRWIWKPKLTAADYRKSIVSEKNVTALPQGGLRPTVAGLPAEVVFKVNGANVITSVGTKLGLWRKTKADKVGLEFSTNNGLTWAGMEIAGETGEFVREGRNIGPANGAYEVLIKVTMQAAGAPTSVALKTLEVETRTMINSKTQPRLNHGRNVIYVDTGDQTDSIVLWPELQNEKLREFAVEFKNMTSSKKHIVYRGTMHPKKGGEEGYVVWRIDAPRDITKITYGGRLFNRAKGGYINFLHSFDGGKTWTKTYSLRDIKPPWDVIKYLTVEGVPPGTKAVLFKYAINAPNAGPGHTSIYAVRMEANHRPVAPGFKPVEVTFRWGERQEDYSLVERSHTQLVTHVPFKYTLNVGGADHPVMRSLRVNSRGAVDDVKYGYSDGRDAGGKKYVGKWVTCGKNLAVGKSYTLSHESMTSWGAGDPDGTKLTDGVCGPAQAGGNSYRFGAIWGNRTNPVITLDLGKPTRCVTLGMNCHGYENWDSLKRQVKDEVEVLTSLDGKEYVSRGFLELNLWWKDLPVNHIWPDDEKISGHTFRIIPEKPVRARYVKYKITNYRFFDVTELEVLDSIKFEPFALGIALPDQK